MKGELVLSHKAKKKFGSDSYEMYRYGEGEYEIVCNGTVYDTGEAEMLGFMPVFNDTSFLYRGENGYFTVAISENHKPSFSKLNKSTGELWLKGIERYWAMKNGDMAATSPA